VLRYPCVERLVVLVTLFVVIACCFLRPVLPSWYCAVTVIKIVLRIVIATVELDQL